MAAAGASVKKAEALEAKGEAALKKFSFFGGGSTTKFEEAAECYDDAGKMWVMGKAYAEGARAYERAAELHLKSKAEFEAGSSKVKAAEAAQKQGDFERCASNYREAIGLYAGLGKCAMAAGAAKKCGEILEDQANNDPAQLAQAVEVYKDAVDMYDTENRPQAASGCREKIATLSASMGAYAEAAQYFEDLGRQSLSSNLGKFNAKKWFTNAVLCCLALEDSVKAANKLQEFSGLDFSFDPKTREHALCSQLIAALDANDGDAVATAAADYDRIKRLDPWMTKLLLAIKSHVDSADAHAEPAPLQDHLPDEPPDEQEADDLPDLT